MRKFNYICMISFLLICCKDRESASSGGQILFKSLVDEFGYKEATSRINELSEKSDMVAFDYATRIAQVVKEGHTNANGQMSDVLYLICAVNEPHTIKSNILPKEFRSRKVYFEGDQVIVSSLISEDSSEKLVRIEWIKGEEPTSGRPDYDYN